MNIDKASVKAIDLEVLAARLIPGAVIFADHEDHVADLRSRAVQALRPLFATLSTPASVPGYLKPLDWDVQKHDDGDEYHTAHVPGGTYMVQRTAGGHQWQYNFGYPDDDTGSCESIDEGKEKAWEHWCERMSPALSASPTPPVVEDDDRELRSLEEFLCGGEVNGGFIRDLCFTVWSLCHNPTHEDGNTDWSNDTLPTVQEAVAKVRAALSKRASASGPTNQPVQGDGWLPIESAPKDCKAIDVWCVHPGTGGLGTRIADVRWRGDDSGWGFVTFPPGKGADWEYLERDGPSLPAWKPTHWRPLPAPPLNDGARS